jgi:hypothetical protein
MKILVGFALSLILSGLARAQNVIQERQCQSTTIPVARGLQPDGIRISESSISTETVGVLRGEITARNQTGRSLSLLTVMVNYLDEHGSILTSVPFQANMENERNHLQNIRPVVEIRLHSPIEPGGRLTLISTNLLCLTKVPASAEVAFWVAYFRDGSSVNRTLGQRGFRTDPILTEASSHLQVTLSPPDEPIEILFKLQISEYGKVLNVGPVRAADSAITQDQLQAVSSQLIHWRFFPAVVNGYATKSDLLLLVIFRPENALPVKGCFSEHPEKYPEKFAVLSLQPLHDGSDNWIPYYGGFPGTRTMEPIIIELGSTKPPDDGSEMRATKFVGDSKP